MTTIGLERGIIETNRKYLIAVTLLAVLAVVFGLAGTVIPVSEPPLSSSSSDSVTHFMNPPTYDSNWTDITDKRGQFFNVTHDLKTTEALVDLVGRESLTGGDHKLFLGATLYIQGLNQTYGGANGDYGNSLVQTVDGGYAMAGYTYSFGGAGDFWLVKTDSSGVAQWNQTYGGANNDRAYSVVQTGDGGYALAGRTSSFGAGSDDFWLVKNTVEFGSSIGLSMTEFTNSTITLYRGRTDPYWNYVRVRIWTIEEPTWMFGDINQDGIVDIQDVAIVAQNYGQTFSLLSLTSIIGVAGVHQYKKRKQSK